MKHSFYNSHTLSRKLTLFSVAFLQLNTSTFNKITINSMKYEYRNSVTSDSCEDAKTANLKQLYITFYNKKLWNPYFCVKYNSLLVVYLHFSLAIMW